MMAARKNDQPEPSAAATAAAEANEPDIRSQVDDPGPGALPEERVAAIEEAEDEAAGDIKAGVLYRVVNGSAHVTRSDGRDSYHPEGAFLRFAKKPKAFAGQLVEEASAADVRTLEGAGLRTNTMAGFDKDDAVEVVAGGDLYLARLSHARAQEGQR